MTEKVNHPGHYGGDTPYEVIKVLEAWFSHEEYIGFLKGNAIKYMARHRDKGGAEDLAKAAWYANRLAEFTVLHEKGMPPQPTDKITDQTMRDIRDSMIRMEKRPKGGEYL